MKPNPRCLRVRPLWDPLVDASYGISAVAAMEAIVLAVRRLGLYGSGRVGTTTAAALFTVTGVAQPAWLFADVATVSQTIHGRNARGTK